MTLSIIIVNYNVKYHIAQCIDSILPAIKGIDAEIIIVDNHSSDGSVRYLRRNYPFVRIMASNHNLGFSRANNIGIKRATGDYILLLNPDTIVEEDTFRNCLKFMQEHNDCGAIGVCQRHPNGMRAMESRRGIPTPMTAFYKMAGLATKYPQHRKFAKYYMSYLSWEQANPIEVISGAFCFCRRNTLLEAGMLDEDYFMYGEDIDLSYCMLQTGMQNYFLPTNILHYKGESTEKSSFRYVHVFYQAMLIFLSKHYGGKRFFISLPIKLAVYLRASIALFCTLSDKTKKMLGFDTRAKRQVLRYIFILDKKNLQAAQNLANDNALDAEYITLQPEQKSQVLKALNHGKYNNEKPFNFTYMVYDLSVFTFTELIEKFAENPYKNVILGTYNPHKSLVITPGECFVAED